MSDLGERVDRALTKVHEDSAWPGPEFAEMTSAVLTAVRAHIKEGRERWTADLRDALEYSFDQKVGADVARFHFDLILRALDLLPDPQGEEK